MLDGLTKWLNGGQVTGALKRQKILPENHIIDYNTLKLKDVKTCLLFL